MNVNNKFLKLHLSGKDGDDLKLNGVKGIVFDLDGTLISSKIDFLGMKRNIISLLESKGVPKGLLSPNETTVEILRKAESLWGERPEEERREILRMVEGIMDEAEIDALPTVVEVEGTSEALKRLKEMGLRLAVLTRGHRTYAVKALEKTGMLNYFDIILARGETSEPKPSPIALIHATAMMGLKPEEVLLVGDHRIDMECAERAGCRFIGVRTGPLGEASWGENKPRILLDSLKQLTEYLSGEK